MRWLMLVRVIEVEEAVLGDYRSEEVGVRNGDGVCV